MNPYQSFGRSGMQVHAVPESERYIDAAGKRLPWAYERADGADLGLGSRKEPVEKGPFGRSMRRRGTSRSRSKTAEPRKEEDRIRSENVAAEDAIFGRLRSEKETKVAGSGDAVAGAKKDEVKEPMEVLIYGFGEELQWAALSYYENVSQGIILEDYERQQPGSRQDLSRSYGRIAAQRSLTKASLRRKNMFAGGNHWIKVTFDSPEAADLACARSPHVIRGHLVYAEPYRGQGPSKDEALFATTAGAQVTSGALPKSFATNGLNTSPSSSETLTSATATNAPAGSQQPPRMGSLGGAQRNPSQDFTSMTSALDTRPNEALQLRPGRIQGATRATLLPADLALMPKQPKQSWSAWFGGSEIIGATVPRKEDGTFDYDRASFYWKLFYWIDVTFGFDFCGLKAEE